MPSESDGNPQSIRNEVRLTSNRIEEDLARSVFANAPLTQVTRFTVGVVVRSNVERHGILAPPQRDVQAAACRPCKGRIVEVRRAREWLEVGAPLHRRACEKV